MIFKLTILILIWLSIIFIINYIESRKIRAFEMKQLILDKCIEYDKNNYIEFLCTTESSFFWVYSKLPSNTKIVYSFLFIKVDYWLSKEVIEKLNI